MIDLQNRTALVTGGSRGIGRACCTMLAAAGANVMVNCKVETPWADRTAGRIREAGGNAVWLSADVSRPDEAEMLVRETVDRFGGLDIVVNNAGIWERSPIEEMSDREWSETVGVNLTGTFHILRAAVPILKSGGGGVIVNVSSTAGQRGEAFHSHYAATKGAIIAMTKSLAAELAPDGIRVNAAAPGWTETDMTKEALSGPERDAILGKIPMARAGTPEEVAAVVVFLASDLASYVTGEVVNVNGGSVMAG